MNKYELLVIISDTATEDARNATIEKIQTILANNGATIEATDTWGMKKFAYPINYRNEGFYILYTITAPAECPSTAEATFSITENIVRSMFVRK